MAWFSIRAPGSSVTAPCANCQHTDCAQNRTIAASSCEHCGKVIGYDVKVVEPRGGGLAHFVCELKAIDAERARQ